MRKYAMYIVVVGVLAVAVVSLLFAQHYKTEAEKYKYEVKEQTVQNVQLTKQVQTAKADAYKDGLIAMENTDVAYLNGLADKYYATPILYKLFHRMAMGWSYDDGTLNQMTGDYMNGGTQ